jgi:hypothetical protein
MSDGSTYEIHDVVYQFSRNIDLIVAMRNELEYMMDAVEAAIDAVDGRITMNELRMAVERFRD